jgi:diguanylate cyclase (GGDEF)-like protein/PAS domain S-box-containing protein
MHWEEKRIRAEQISLLYRNSIIGFLVSVILGALLCLILYPHISMHRLLTWFLSLLIITTIRFLITRYYQKADPKRLNLRKWEMLFLLSTGLAGVVWGASILVLSPADSSIHQLLILLFLAGLVGGSVGVFSPLFLAFISFTLPITLSVSLKFMFIENMFSIITAILTWVLFISMALTSKHSEQAIRSALALRFDNEILKNEIAERKQSEYALQESNDKFRALTETTQDFIWEVNAEGVYTYCSPQTKNILGYQPAELLGKKPFDFMPVEEAKQVKDIFIDKVKQNKPINMLENINLTKDGREVIIETSGLPFFNNTGELLGYRGIDRDITERKQAETKLKHLAHHDPLTGLANRRQLITDFQHESKRANRFDRKMAFFFLDLNRFKSINDELGHEVGDALLQYIAEMMTHELRETESIYRVGGDEFSILIPEFNNKEQLKGLAKRIVGGISSIDHFAGMEIDIGCSVGIAIYPDDGEKLADLTSASDQAMYYAKHSQSENINFAN